MVPDAFSYPLKMAVVQPRLPSGIRATYLSLQSLCGRFLLAISLFVISFMVPEGGTLDQNALRMVLPIYLVAGALIIGWLVLTVQWMKASD